MKVFYNAKPKTYRPLSDVPMGEIIRPTNSQELYLVSDMTICDPLFDTVVEDVILDKVYNPQDIDIENCWETLTCLTRIKDGTWWFTPSDTEVEVMDCYLNIEE